MPPPKLKIHKSPGSGKLKSIPKPQPSTSQTNPEQREAQEKFEIELAWCIQRLEETLNSGKLNQNQKQYNDAVKSLTTLRCSSQPVIKKRQLMKQIFGDYRAKMADDEKSFSINPNSFKFLSNPRQKSYFVKKAALVNGDKNFKFNFNIDDKMDNLTLDSNSEEKPGSSFGGASKIDFQSGGGEFKFNFAIEE